MTGAPSTAAASDRGGRETSGPDGTRWGRGKGPEAPLPPHSDVPRDGPAHAPKTDTETRPLAPAPPPRPFRRATAGPCVCPAPPSRSARSRRAGPAEPRQAPRDRLSCGARLSTLGRVGPKAADEFQGGPFACTCKGAGGAGAVRRQPGRAGPEPPGSRVGLPWGQTFDPAAKLARPALHPRRPSPGWAGALETLAGAPRPAPGAKSAPRAAACPPWASQGCRRPIHAASPILGLPESVFRRRSIHNRQD